MWRQLSLFLPLTVILADLIQPIPGQLGFFISVVLVCSVLFTFLKDRDTRSFTRLIRSALLGFGAALATFYLANAWQLGSVVASGITGLLVGLILPESDQGIAYMAVFIGMSSASHFPSFWALSLTGLWGGLLWEYFDQDWLGIGGKMGTVAAIAVLTSLWIGGGT